MKVTFLSKLHVEKMDDEDKWVLIDAFIAQVDERKIVVPAGFHHDFASVPRIPLAYMLAGNTAHKSAVIHDWLYTVGEDRKYADSVFYAAMEAEGVPWFRRNAMWAAVRMFGGGAYTAKAA